MSQKIFDSFTNQYPLSKTLRFELRPEWNTSNILEEEKIFDKGDIRHKKYEETKPWIDRLHREFIEEALEDFKFNDLNNYKSALEELEKDKKSEKNKDNLKKEEGRLRKEIVSQFNKKASEWIKKYSETELKKEDVNFLFEAHVFELMKEKYKGEEGTIIVGKNKEEINIFDDWKGWVGYFAKFFETRKNFYSSGDEQTAVAYRIVNENLKRFIKNIGIFNKIKNDIDIIDINNRLGILCEDIFTLNHYNKCLLQKDIDKYNLIIGGYVDKETDSKIPGINQAVNEYRQKTDNKIPFLTSLDKQIHSEKDKFLDLIESDKELFDHLKKFIFHSDEKFSNFRELISNLIKSEEVHKNDFDLGKIYISSSAIERNASRWFADYNQFEERLFDLTKKDYKEAYKKNNQTFNKKEGRIKLPDFIILSHIKDALISSEGNIFKEKYQEGISGFNDYSNFVKFLKIIEFEIDNLFTDQKNGYDVFRKKIDRIIEQKDEKVTPELKIIIKNLADTSLRIYQVAKYFAVEKKRRWLDQFDLDGLFYNSDKIGYLNFYSNAYKEIVGEYNLIRNYLTKKNYNTDKWLIKFNIKTLAKGWDLNKEKENGAIILRKNNCYYLGIMHHKHKKLFEDKNSHLFSGKGFEKMEYKYFPGASKMITKCSTQLSEVKKHFKSSNDDYTIVNDGFSDELIVSRSVFDLNNVFYSKEDPSIIFYPKNNEEKKEGVKKFQKEYLRISGDKEEYKKALQEWIEFCIYFLKKYKSTQSFDFSLLKKPSDYTSLDEFYKEVDSLTYAHKFVSISEDYIREKNKEGELFIFKIHNKDWNFKDGKPKTGSKNSHTIYFENLFSEENKNKNFIFKLNGEAELFFRPKTDKDKLGTKKDDSGKEIINHFRYSKDKIFFHCPIELNRVSERKTERELNTDIRETLSEKPEVNIIGIDRGEKHLAYYYVIDQEGNRIDSGSLNKIGSVNYAKILEERSKNREQNRRDWKDIEEIKNLKKGYISQIVRKLADLAVEHNAIIVLEDLNMRFKQIRGGIEKSIYQQLEKQLIDKLSFFIDKKETNSNKPGHCLKAYQLAAPIDSFKKMGKQTGILFYTAAGYTSKTCPKCGFRRNIKFKFSNIRDARETIGKMKSFYYDKSGNAFIFSYNLSDFLNKEQLKTNKTKNKLYKEISTKEKFTITTKEAIRYKWFKKESPRIRVLLSNNGVSDYGGEEKEGETKRGVIKKFDLTAYIKNLLESFGVNLNNEDLTESIKVIEDREFFNKLLFALYLLTETRQSISNTDIDYIQCSCCSFDSRKGFQDDNSFNGDTNGAYNIARKGIMIIEKIRQFKKNKEIKEMGWEDLSISIKEWDKFTQKQHS